MSDGPTLHEDPELLKSFVAEARESLETVEGLLVDLERSSDPGVIQAIFRPIHSLKGNAAFFGLLKIRNVAHDLENLLDLARRGRLAIDGGIVDLLLQGIDRLRLLCDRVGEGTSDPATESAALEQFRRELQAVATAQRPGPAGPSTVPSGAARPDPGTPPVNPLALALAAIPQGQSAVMAALDLLPSWAANPETGFAAASFRTDLEAIIGATGWSEVVCDVLREQLPRMQTEHAWRSPNSAPPDRGTVPHGEVETALAPLLEETTRSHRPATSGPQDAGLLTTTRIAHRNVPRQETTGRTKRSDGSDTSRQERDDQIRIPAARIDGFLAEVGELLVLSDLFAQVEERLAVLPGSEDVRRDLRQALGVYGQVTAGLRQTVIALRQVSARRLLQKAPRLVRDVATSRRKEIHVVLAGEDLGLDKAIVDLLDAPLVHLVRNAADHGIELPERRVLAGKRSQGTIRVEIAETPTEMVLSVADDGGGLDLERIQAKAVESGLVAPGATLTREDIIAFIFASGVSTAAEVTDVSGRGVGLDVVRQAIESAGGRIEIDTVRGAGATFRVRVPKNVRTQILSGFLVGVGEHTFIFPLDRIDRAVALESLTIQRLPDGGDRVLVDGRTYAHHRLGDLTGFPAGPGRITVLLKAAGEVRSLAVDAVLGVRQVMVRRIEGRRCGTMVDGGAVMGNGRVAIILDPDRLFPG